MKNRQSNKTSANAKKAEEVLILPGCLFFIETVEVPSSLEASEVPDFAELSLESISPFPIDQLNWGYLYHEGASTLLLYATHRDRLKNLGYSNLNEYAWALPDFATLAGACFTEDTLVALESTNSVSLLYFKRNTKIPQSIGVDTLDTSMFEHTVEMLKSGIKDLPEETPCLHLKPVTTTLSENDLCIFEQTPTQQTEDLHSKGSWQKLTPTESQLWQADVRYTYFKKAEHSKRQTSALIRRITGWAAIFAVILIGIEGVLIATENWLNTQIDLIEAQRNAVSKVEEKQILVNKLEQVAQNELRPIEILEAANNIRLRLKLGIEYDSVVVENENHITIEGKASSVNSLNRYAENLKNSGRFELLETPEYLTRAGKTTFKVSLAYKPDISIEEDSTSQEEAPANEIPASTKETKT